MLSCVGGFQRAPDIESTCKSGLIYKFLSYNLTNSISDLFSLNCTPCIPCGTSQNSMYTLCMEYGTCRQCLIMANSPGLPNGEACIYQCHGAAETMKPIEGVY